MQRPMKAIETSAAFDESGKLIIDNLPPIKNKKVKLLILIDEESDDNDSFLKLSEQGLSKAYSNEEPDYDISLVTEPNPFAAAQKESNRD